jgi:hypothetical protein
VFRKRGAGGPRWAAIFAEDLLGGCDQLYRVFEGDVLALPISIPMDERGLVVLLPGAPPLDAPRVPSVMTVTRPSAGVYGIRIERTDGQPLRVPGVNDQEPLSGLSFVVDGRGLAITDQGAPLRVDEHTARALANALLITIGMKLRKATDGTAGSPPTAHPRSPDRRSR